MPESEKNNFEAVSIEEQHVLRYIKLLRDTQTPVVDRQKIIEELEKILDHSKKVVTILHGKETSSHKEQVIRREEKIIILITEALKSL